MSKWGWGVSGVVTPTIALAYLLTNRNSGQITKLASVGLGGSASVVWNAGGTALAVGSASSNYIAVSIYDTPTTKLRQSINNGIGYTDYDTGVYAITSRIRFDRSNHDIGWVFTKEPALSDVDKENIFKTISTADDYIYPVASDWYDFAGDFMPIKFGVTTDGATWSFAQLDYLMQLAKLQITSANNAYTSVIFASADELECGNYGAGTGLILLQNPDAVQIGYKTCGTTDEIWDAFSSYLNFWYPRAQVYCAPAHDGEHCYAAYRIDARLSDMPASGNWDARKATFFDYSGYYPAGAESQYKFYKVKSDGTTVSTWSFAATDWLPDPNAWLYDMDTDPTTALIWALGDNADFDYQLYIIDFDDQTITASSLAAISSYSYALPLVTDSGVIMVIELDGANDPPDFLRIYRSVDSGSTWSIVDMTALIPSELYYGLTADIATTGRIYVAIGKSILWSDDDGATWNATNEIMNSDASDMGAV